jgi:superfamily II DNA or RNA helicase
MTEEEKVIIFCERIAQTEKLYESIRKIPGMKAGHYHSEMTDEMKKYYLDQFRSGSHRILVTCKALDEGLDVPDASVGIIVSSSSNDRQRIQRLGRILRKNERKKAVLYYLYTSASADRIYYLKELAKDTDLIEMTYLPEENGFICEEYEKAAEEVINERNPDERNRQEMLRCAELGISRGDWLLDESSYESHINNAVRQSEKNYWNMMKWIHQKYITNKSD